MDRSKASANGRAKRGVYLLDGKAVERLFKRHAPGVDTSRARAEILGLDESTYHRLLKGLAVPSNQTIFRTLDYFEQFDVDFYDLFQKKRARR